MRLTITVLLVKLLVKILRIFKSGGTSLPGKIAAKIYPNILSVISSRIKTVFVTGTNGKTTTVRMITGILKAHDIKYITNKSGANLQSGITTTLLNAMKLNGRFDEEYAVLEVDEAALKTIAPLIKPDYVVVTNFFRDQLDRFGELYTLLSGVKEGLSSCPNTKLILNGDDSFCASIGKDLPNEAYYYGTRIAFGEYKEGSVSDGRFCIYCKVEYLYRHHTYGHLGDFYCPECGFSRSYLLTALSETPVLTDKNTKILLSIGDPDNKENVQTIEGTIPVPGQYNIYNAMAAITLSKVFGFDPKKSVEALAGFEIGFGRMEDIRIGNKTLRMVLVKNVVGFDQALELFISQNKPYPAAMIINDLTADGRDISWLWDVEFEKLGQVQEVVPAFFTSGLRGEDMTVRLKYAGLDMKKVRLIKDYNLLVDKGLAITPENGYFYVFPSYTALLDFRKLLVRRYGIKKFWK
jgi:UDP-N-acetylmuramyl tripeptide synthase